MRITNGVPGWVIALAILALLLLVLRGLAATAYLGREAAASTVSNAWLAVSVENNLTFVHFASGGALTVHNAATRQSPQAGTWRIDEAGRLCIAADDTKAPLTLSGCYRLSKGSDRFLAVDGEGRALRVTPLSVTEHRISLDPSATYIRTASDPGASAARPIDLSALGLAPGDIVAVSSYGQFNCCKGGGVIDGRLHRSLVGVFSANSVLLQPGNRHRVPGAIAAGPPVNTIATYFGNAATDIQEDFTIYAEPLAQPSEQREALLTIPEGARTLFLSPHDSHFGDNRTVGQWGVVLRHLTEEP